MSSSAPSESMRQPLAANAQGPSVPPEAKRPKYNDAPPKSSAAAIEEEEDSGETWIPGNELLLCDGQRAFQPQCLSPLFVAVPARAVRAQVCGHATRCSSCLCLNGWRGSAAAAEL